ncbi:MAG: hypothetical protein DELT_02835 [Desulfovibrio sp.]
MPNALAPFVHWLSERRDFLRNLEKEAVRVLQEDKNPDKYRSLMCQKAQFLEALPEEAEKHMAGIPEATAGMIEKRLGRFSHNASQALELDSVFYMYALLYPDDHKEGEPNDLDRFVAELAEKANA